MDGELIVWGLIIAFWLISNFIKFIGRVVAKGREVAEQQKENARPGTRRQEPPRRPGLARETAPPSPPPPPTTSQSGEDALAELLKSFGVDIDPSTPEQPVASEHVETRSEHMRTASETQRTRSEHDHTPGWHERSASEVSQSASEISWSVGEHRGTPSEHVAGDVFVPDLPDLPPPEGRTRSSGLGPRVVAELHTDREALARAFILREVLGPPVGLRSSSDRGFES